MAPSTAGLNSFCCGSRAAQRTYSWTPSTALFKNRASGNTFAGPRDVGGTWAADLIDVSAINPEGFVAGSVLVVNVQGAGGKIGLSA